MNLTASKWQHLAFVFYYDGNQKIDYYKNGIFQTTEAGGTDSSFAWSGFNIGNINNGSSGDFSGYMDDFRIYDYALSQIEISGIYNSGSGLEDATSDYNIVDNGATSSTGAFTSSITGLTVATTYHTKAYMISQDGQIAYGAVDTFTTTGGNSLPVASNVSVDSGASDIDLTAGTTKQVTCSSTVTDSDGYTNITSVEAKLYRTGVGHAASDDDNNHYSLSGDTDCVPSNGSGNTEDYTCTFDVYFHADPTDTGSAYDSDNWTCRVLPSDNVGAGTADTDTIEMNSLRALNITSSIDFGLLEQGNNTGSTNQESIIQNYGNSPIDLEISGVGSNMCSDYPACSADTISITNQEYALTAFTYGAGTDLTSLPVLVNISIPKPTASPSNSSDSMFWGIAIPSFTSTGVFSGENLFTATTDT